MTKYDLAAFIEAHISAAKWERAHPDLALYHAERARALRLAFRIEPRELPGSLAWVFEDAVRAIVQTHAAFDGMLECPRDLTPLLERHAPSIDAAVKAFRDAHLDLIRDLLESAYACRDTIVTSDDLRRIGFDDSAAPDSVDYF